MSDDADLGVARCAARTLLWFAAALLAAALARCMRLRRIALLVLAVALVLMLTSATLTLSLQGQAGDQQDEMTTSA